MGDTDLTEADLQRWREEIAWLPQRPYLPERGTVGDAMTLIPSALTRESMIDALAEIGVLHVLERHSPGDPAWDRCGGAVIGREAEGCHCARSCQEGADPAAR